MLTPLRARIAFRYTPDTGSLDSKSAAAEKDVPLAMNLVLSTIVQILIYLVRTYTFVLLASAILRLVRADETSPIVKWIHLLADPPARALTRRFPKLVLRSGHQLVDLGPIILLVGLGCLVIILENVLRSLA